MDVYISRSSHAGLYVIGAGHVGTHLARRARGRLPCARGRRPREVRQRGLSLATKSSSNIPRGSRASLPPYAYVVIVTRGHTNDLEALRGLAPELRYLGLIGSRAVARIYAELAGDHLPPRCSSGSTLPSASTSAP
jgi:xanthine/CO dehydrogenase XdhC/CoxF family maturation factor